MNPALADKMDLFVEACHQVAAQQLIRCNSGNLSWRIDEELFLISPHRRWLGTLRPEDVAVCRLSDGSVVSGLKPSSETPFHQAVLQARPDMDVVLHFQTPNATAIACTGRRPDYFLIPEVPYYIGEIGWVPYFTPGSTELADAVVEQMKDHDLAQMANHGQITVGKDFNDAFLRASFFELASEILIKTHFEAAPIDEEGVREIIKSY